MSVEDKIAIISGASGGLGQTVSRIFHKAGAMVVVVGSRPEKVNALADELGLDRVHPQAANLVDPAGAKASSRQRWPDLVGLIFCSTWPVVFSEARPSAPAATMI